MTHRQANWKVQFLSDNASPVCPEAWEAMEKANSDAATNYTLPYGEDPITAEAAQRIADLFETECHVFFVFNGSAANCLALASMSRSYHGILCHPSSHTEIDEANGPEFFTGGAKLLSVDGPEGKIDPRNIPARLARGDGVHSAKINALSMAQPTEVGTVYTPAEIRAITSLRTEMPDVGFTFHMDGARFANALAALDGVAPSEITWRAGVDVLSLGGTKNGGPATEALVFFDKQLAHDFGWRRKQAGQLASKMRYLSAPWLGLLEGETWVRYARHANQCAATLGAQLTQIPGVALRYKVETNAVFAALPDGVAGALEAAGWHFYRSGSVCRFMCGWNTTEDAIAALVSEIQLAVETHAS
ncbi:MAG TPA: threonine aldolase [Planctomycetaceae bacterium]|nr:threonine aldolase [Planctomycetaceae bacterium]